ncbi:MAG: hypothetical protein GXP26_01230 [Planctomycetes bacterium]|nr:hypothetical protein [Planctomycetota bacterium]
MKNEILTATLSIATLAIIAGCGTAPASTPQQSEATANPAANVDASLYKLAEEPDGAIGVIMARESAEDGAPLILVGRIGGSANPWIEGRAAFMLLDASMSVVAEGDASDEGEDEICMGDCCATERLDCTTLVKVVDSQGKIVPVDSRKLLGLKESDMVVVEGTAKKDDSGNFVMLARGIYVRK